ncbi:MAG: VOC family protein [Bacteroidetes bacterium]|nr:MAG: VOC family protein [Bacteroidota bacterium]
MARIIGFGGVFLKARDPEKLKKWYVEVLGAPLTPEGYVVFSDDPQRPAYAVWSAMDETTTYFAPSEKDFMINFRVDDMAGMLERLRQAGVEVLGEEKLDYGHFAWVMDPEGTKVELWEPRTETFKEQNSL